MLGLFQPVEKLHAAAGSELLQRVRTGAEMLIGIAQVADLADHADREIARPPALADAGIEHRRFLRGLAPMISTASACSMPFDGRIEDVARAAERRIERRHPGGSRCSWRAERPSSALQRVHVLDGRQVTRDGADLVAMPGLRDRILDGGKGLFPGRRLQLAVRRT
jgi:hypothetical protein